MANSTKPKPKTGEEVIKFTDPEMERIHKQAPKFTPEEADELERAITSMKTPRRKAAPR